MNEYHVLKKVIMAEPTYMKITEVINEVQKKYSKENINTNKALYQHRGLAETLKKEGVEILYLENDPSLNEQVFTRDIGFVIEGKVCVASCKEEIRKKRKRKNDTKTKR